MPGPVLCVFPYINCFNVDNNPVSFYYYPFTDEETEAQRTKLKQDFTAGEWKSRDSNKGSLISECACICSSGKF